MRDVVYGSGGLDMVAVNSARAKIEKQLDQLEQSRKQTTETILRVSGGWKELLNKQKRIDDTTQLQSRVETLESTLNDIEEHMKRLKNTHDDEIKQYRDAWSICLGNNASLLKQLELKESELVQANADNEQFKTSLSDSVESLEHIKTSIDVYNESILVLESEITTLLEKMVSFENLKQEHSHTLQELEQLRTQHGDAMDASIEEQTNQAKTIRTLEKNTSGQKERIHALEALEQEQADELKRFKEQMKSQSAEYEQRVKEKTDELLRVRQEMETRIAQYEEQLEALRKHIQNTRKKKGNCAIQ
jgi:chromosome segregation ATPase